MTQHFVMLQLKQSYRMLLRSSTVTNVAYRATASDFGFACEFRGFCAGPVAHETGQSATSRLDTVARQALREIQEAGTYKHERFITSPQSARISLEGSQQPVLNFCANNYLGLSNHPDLVRAAKRALDTHGFGLSSVRFICGTQDMHKQLERRIAEFHGMDDAILFPSCFDANAGLFEALLTSDDAIISDTLNHASIIDGIRLCKAQRLRYSHMDMSDLQQKLRDASGARVRMVATDGVFSMDGDVAPLPDICRLAHEHSAAVFIDECHATGFLGPSGRGTEDYWGLKPGTVDIINSTLGKALGGATGGYSTGRAEVIELLRQKARPYLFSNTVAPAVVAAGIATFDLLSRTTHLRDALESNTKYFRSRMTEAGFNIRPGSHPIVPIMLGDARLANEMATRLLSKGIYVVGFSYPVVPKGQARIRVQLSAAHTQEHLDTAIAMFTDVARELGVLDGRS